MGPPTAECFRRVVVVTTNSGSSSTRDLLREGKSVVAEVVALGGHIIYGANCRRTSK